MPSLSDFPTAIDSYSADVDGVTTIAADDVNEARDFAVAAQVKIGADADALSAATLEGRAKYQEAGGLKRGSSVSSATSITLADTAQVFPITGTATIATIAAPTYPRLVYLEFASALTLDHGTGNLTLPGASDLLVPAGAVVALEWTGSTWRVAGGGSDAPPIDPAANVGGSRTLGTGAQQAAAGNDSRLSDARTPTAHATSHVTVGQDPLPTFTATTRGLVPPPGGSPTGVKALYDNGTWADPAVASGGMSNPMAHEDSLIVGGAGGDPTELEKGTDLQVVGVDPSDHHVKFIDVPSKHVIYDETSPVADQPVLAFQGSGVTVTNDALDGATIVTIPGGSAAVFTTSTDGLVPGPSGSEDDSSHVLAGDGTWLDTSTLGGGGGGGSSLGQLAPLVPPSKASVLTTWVNQGSASATDEADGLFLQGPASSGAGELHCLVQALTAGRKTKLGFLPAHRWVNFITVGIVITDGTTATSKAVAFGLTFSSGWAVNVVHYSNLSGATGTADFTESPVVLPALFWLHVDDTGGTNFAFGISPDGVDAHVVPLFAQGRGSILTPSHVGIFVASNLANVAPALKAVHWSHV